MEKKDCIYKYIIVIKRYDLKYPYIHMYEMIVCIFCNNNNNNNNQIGLIFLFIYILSLQSLLLLIIFS